ncbi:MAG: tungstate ABC transporter substrate-binding protein WtpA [Candidatus Helarchaeota archaeon]
MAISESFWSKHKNKIIIILIIAMVVLSTTFISIWMWNQESKTNIQIFHAGSLYVPIEEYQKEYEALYPSYQIDNEAYGSATAIRQLTELGRKCSVIGSADYTLIYTMMMNKSDSNCINPETGDSFADWYIIFAANEMALAYIENNNPPYLNELKNGSKLWWEVLNRTDVTFGRADPYQDPCGYRTLMVWGLADDYYFGLLKGNWTSNKINKSMFMKDPISGYNGPGKTVVKAKEVDLISSLQLGEIDYLFIYTSVAVQHGLNYIKFTDYINLANITLNDFYANVTVCRKSPLISGASADPITAKSIQYGLTVPNNAPHYDVGVDFVKFIIQRPGVMQELGQRPYYPALASNISKIPEELIPYCIQDPNPIC